MIPIRTKIKGFGPHRDTTVDWTKAGTLTAIVAENGTGKTFLIEGIIAALYGRFPSRNDFYGCLTEGGTGEFEIEVEFEHEGVHYRAVRYGKYTEKSSSQSCYLYLWDGDITLAGPKVGDFEQCVAARFGKYETAVATWFASQGSRGDLCTVAASERRDVFAQLIHLEDLTRKAEKISKMARDIEVQIETLDAQLGNDDALEAEINRQTGLALQAKVDLQNSAHQIAALEKQIEEVRASLRDASGGDDVLKEQIAVNERAVAGRERACAALAAHDAKINELGQKAERVRECEIATERLAELSKDEQDLREQEARSQAYTAWQSKVAEAEAKLGKAKAELQAAEAKAGVSPEDEQLASTVDALVAEYKTADAALKAWEQNNEGWKRGKAQAENALSVAEAHYKSLQERLDRRPSGAGLADACMKCSLYADFANLPGALAEAKAVVDERASIIANPPPAPPKPTADLSDIRSRGELARAAQKRVEAAKSAKDEIEHKRGIIVVMEQSVASLMAAQPPAAESAAVKLAALRQDRQKYEPLAMLLSGAKAAAESLASAIAERPKFVLAINEAQERIAASLEAANSAREALRDRAARLATIRQEEVRLSTELVDCRKAHTDATSREAAATQSAKHHRADLEKNQKKREEISGLRAKAGMLRQLETCFGKTGVQPILIDQAAPRLEAIAADMLEKLTDGKMSLRIATQEQNRSNGRMRETFLILAGFTAGHYRDVMTFSGGEKRLLQTVLRLSVMLWNAEMHGRPADCIVVDEGFDALDEENTERMVKVLSELDRMFGRVIVVTHNAHIADRLPHRIRLESCWDGVSVEYLN